MNAADRKLLMGVFSVIFLITLIFRKELLPFFFPETGPQSFIIRKPPPVIDSILSSTSPTKGGTEILITGANLCDDPAHTSVAIGASYCTNIKCQSITELICTLPPGVGDNLPVIVSVNNLPNEKPALFSYDRPSVTGIILGNFQGKTTGREIVTIQGTNFGTKKANYPINVYFGDFIALDVEMISENALEVVTPKGYGKDLPTIVQVGGQKSSVTDHTPKISYSPPVVEAIEPETGPATGGTVIYIYGNNFGVHSAFPKAFVGGVPCVFITFKTSSLLECVLPAGTGKNKAITVTVGGQTSRGSVMFSYDAPSVSSISPDSGPTAGNSIVTIYGANFGSQPSTSRDVLFSNSHCSSTTWISDTEITCTTPLGSGSDVPVSVIVDGQSSEPKPVWSYGQPTILKISPNHGPVSGGTLITIQGTNFGHDSSHLQAISIDTVPCLEIHWVSTTSISCVTPPGAGKDLPVRVTIDGVPGRSDVWSYDAALLQSISPKTGPAEGGVLVTITGKNFGNTQTDIRIFIGDVRCTTSHVVDDSHATCLLPPGSGVDLTVEVITNGIPSILEKGFSYFSPKILDIDPSFVDTSGGRVTIFGESFGTAESDASVKINGKNCPVITNTKSMIICMAPSGTGANLPVIVSIDGQESAPLNKFSYEIPIVNDIEPRNGEKFIAVTIFGNNFGESNSDVVVTIGGVECPVSKWIAEMRVTCMTPDTTGKNLPVVVSINGAKSAINPEVTFSYGDNRPQVKTITPSHGPLAGGNAITITGSNLNQQYITVEFGNGNKASSLQKTDDKIIVPSVPKCPFDQGGLVTVKVKNDDDDVLGTSALQYTYDLPAVQQQQPITTTTTDDLKVTVSAALSQKTADGSSLLTVIGTFTSIYSKTDLSVSLRFYKDGEYSDVCKPADVISTSKITCSYSGSVDGLLVAVSVSKGTSLLTESNKVTFS